MANKSCSLVIAAGLAGVISVALGCSSSDKPAPTSAAGATSVDQAKALSALSASEMQTLCTDFEAYLVKKTGSAFAQRSCTQAALVAAGMSDPSAAAAACNSAYDSCMNDPGNSKNSSGVLITALCPSVPSAPACSLTVSQYVECLDQLISAALAAWDLRSNLCNNLASCSGTCNTPMTLPAACAQVNTTCPGLVPTATYTTVSG